MLDFGRRVETPEIMDTELLSDPEMRRTLRFISQTNRYFGGDQVVFHYLERWSRSWPTDRPVTFLDVGTGGAELPVRILRWSRKRGLNVRVTGIDSTPAIARLARENSRTYSEIEIVHDDLRAFASGGRTFDVVLASLLLHHIRNDSLIDVLKTCDRLASRAVLFSDLRRSRSGYWATKALTGLFGNRVVQNDGPLSIRRAFTEEELQRLAGDAGLGYLQARRHPFFRLSLAGQKSA